MPGTWKGAGKSRNEARSFLDLFWDCCLDRPPAEGGPGLELNLLCLGLGNELGKCSPVQGGLVQPRHGTGKTMASRCSALKALLRSQPSISVAPSSNADSHPHSHRLCQWEGDIGSAPQLPPDKAFCWEMALFGSRKGRKRCRQGRGDAFRYDFYLGGWEHWQAEGRKNSLSLISSCSQHHDSNTQQPRELIPVYPEGRKVGASPGALLSPAISRGTHSHPGCSLPPHLMSPPWLSQGDRHHTTTPMARHNPTNAAQRRVHHTRIHSPVHLLHKQRHGLLFPHVGPSTLGCPRCKPPSTDAQILHRFGGKRDKTTGRETR